MSLMDLILKLASDTPLVGPAVNRAAINHFAASTVPRPRPFSLWSPGSGKDPAAADYVSDYTSWPSLTNREFSGRHLPPADREYIARLTPNPVYAPGQPPGPVTSLFARTGHMTPSRSSLLFMFFAQWFTDSVLRFNPLDRRKNTSNHDIDLCEIYGLTEEHANILRTHRGGLLRSDMRVTGATGVAEEYPEYLCATAEGRVAVRPEFRQLRGVATISADEVVDAVLGADFIGRKRNLYATGLERGNSTIGYTAISTIFVREHNRIAKQLLRNNPAWDDERVFQTARNINIVILLKLVVEDYINHILGQPLFKLDHEFAEDQRWYRPNWIAVEFDLLYRWHALAPDAIQINGKPAGPLDFRYNNALLEQVGVGALIDAASRQRAGRIMLGNTPSYLLTAESLSVKMGRDFRLRPYNEYRARFGLTPLADFSSLTRDTRLQQRLADIYRDVNDVEFVVGLLAEEAEDGALFGDLLTRMVAYDAFTQIFTNPLISTNVYGPATFTDYGIELIEQTTSIEVLVNRNVPTPVRASLRVLPE